MLSIALNSSVFILKINKLVPGCPPSPSHSVSLVQCNLNGTPVNCNRNATLGTKAKLQCMSSYHNVSAFKLYTETECSLGFKWLPLPESCLDCGKRYKFNTYIPLAVYKKRTVSEYPWHVGLYLKNKSNDTMLFCGGTIIHPNAVITAAHCVYNNSEENYSIAVGKFNRSWHNHEPAEQRFQIKKIHIKYSYKASSRFLGDDLAVLEINGTIKLSDYIMPVCIDWGGKLNLYSNPLILGTAPGWGFTEDGNPINELRASKLRCIDTLWCIKHYDINEPIAPDKFCAVSADGSIPGRGDSGGSITFPRYNGETGEEISYLYGIISIKVKRRDEAIILFSNITHHLEWMKAVLISIINNGT